MTAAGTIASASAGRSPIVALTGTRPAMTSTMSRTALGVERTESARGRVFAVDDAGSAAKRHLGLGRIRHAGEKGGPVSSQTFDHSVIRGSDPRQVAAKMRFCSASTAARSRRSASLRFTTASCATLASPGARRKMRVPS